MLFQRSVGLDNYSLQYINPPLQVSKQTKFFKGLYTPKEMDAKAMQVMTTQPPYVISESLLAGERGQGGVSAEGC